MKKIMTLIMSMMLTATLTACAQQPPQADVQSPSSDPASQSTSSAESSAPTGNASVSTPEPATSEEPTSKVVGGTLVIYFSATGNTKAVAETIAKTADGDLYEIVPQEPYTADDLNWNDEGSRVSAEHNNPDSRPAIAGELPDLSGYQTVFIGYPSWWGEAPNIVRTLAEGVDFAGKTVIPFCTSSSSGLGSSGETLAALTSDATWLEGQRFRGSADEAEVVDWVNGLDI